MKTLFDDINSAEQHRPVISESELDDEGVIRELIFLKEKLKDQVTVLGHHYQQDDIIRFADVTGDSLGLAKHASNLDHPYVVFCGVHFMAETADMLCRSNQQVILPDMNAGCSMADMATSHEIEAAWKYLVESSDDNSKIVPITYINCSAELKSFVGENGGSICTSSNAREIIKWAFETGDKLLFFPDQHLGRNTCYDMGVPLDDMVVYDPSKPNGGLTPEEIRAAKVILWYGFCSVHQGFTPRQIDNIKQDSPETVVIVHPECSFDVVRRADKVGSTKYIIDEIAAAAPGTRFAVGTEINLVNRLGQWNPDKEIVSLSPYQCLCTTMYRVRPRWLLETFRSIDRGTPINVIKVPEAIKRNSLLALEQMFALS